MAAPMRSVTGCRYTPALADPANCCITVNGSWWRPTISSPKIRSDGAPMTGAAMACGMSRAAPNAPCASAASRRKMDHHGHNQRGTEQRPGANVAHRRHERRVGEHPQRGADRDLHEGEKRETDS